MAHAQTVAAQKSWSGGDAPFNISWGKMMMWFFLVSDALTFSSLLIYYGATRNMNREFWPNPDEVYNHFPMVEGHIPLAFVSLMTFILIMSSVTMVLAVEAGHRFDKKGVIKWMIWTIIGGFIFLGSQAYEWYHFIHGTELGAIELGIGTYTLPDGTIEQTQGIIARWADESKQVLLLPWREIATDNTSAYLTLSGQAMQDAVAGGHEVFGANLTHNEYGHPLFGDFFFFITGFHGTHVFSGVVLNFIIFVNVIMGTYQKRGHYEMVEKVGLYWHFVDLVWVFVFTFFYLV